MTRYKIDFCIHHSDHDGWASAAVVKAEKNMAIGYGRDINNSALLNMVAGKNVAIVDFSFPQDTMEFIIKLAKSVLWIDHHLDSEPLKILFDNPKVDGIWDDTKAGCLLTWEWFKGTDTEPPDCIKYIADRDIRAGQYDESIYYSYGLNTVPSISDPLDQIWNELLEGKFSKELLNVGKILRTSFENDALWHARMRTNICGKGDKQFILTNGTHLVSDISEYLIETFNIPIVLIWNISKGVVKFSGRGEGCRDFFYPLLKGHPNACGGIMPLEKGLEFIGKLYSMSRRVTP